MPEVLHSGRGGASAGLEELGLCLTQLLPQGLHILSRVCTQM